MDDADGLIDDTPGDDLCGLLCALLVLLAVPPALHGPDIRQGVPACFVEHVMVPGVGHLVDHDPLLPEPDVPGAQPDLGAAFGANGETGAVMAHRGVVVSDKVNGGEPQSCISKRSRLSRIISFCSGASAVIVCSEVVGSAVLRGISATGACRVRMIATVRGRRCFVSMPRQSAGAVSRP